MNKKIGILLVEDDEDDYIIIQNSLHKIDSMQFDLIWARSYDEALQAFEQRHDVCLMDLQLGEKNGLELVKKLKNSDYRAPIIILTGHGDRDLDIKVMHLGVSDYLEKGRIHPDQLERSIRYSIEKSIVIEALKKSETNLRAISLKILRAQEDERKFIAKELHDSIGSSVTAIKFALEKKQDDLMNDRDPSGLSLSQIIKMTQNTIDEIHRISSNLRPSILDHLGLIVSLRALCREFQAIHKNTSIGTEFNIQEEDIPEPLKIIIYRILQEALNNVSKHSGADRVRLSFSMQHEGIELIIEDKGRGFDRDRILDKKSNSAGMGLDGMRERVMLSNGQFTISSKMGLGTTIRAFWAHPYMGCPAGSDIFHTTDENHPISFDSTILKQP